MTSQRKLALHLRSYISTFTARAPESRDDTPVYTHSDPRHRVVRTFVHHKVPVTLCRVFSCEQGESINTLLYRYYFFYIDKPTEKLAENIFLLFITILQYINKPRAYVWNKKHIICLTSQHFNDVTSCS